MATTESIDPGGPEDFLEVPLPEVQSPPVLKGLVPQELCNHAFEIIVQHKEITQYELGNILKLHRNKLTEVVQQLVANKRIIRKIAKTRTKKGIIRTTRMLAPDQDSLKILTIKLHSVNRLDGIPCLVCPLETKCGIDEQVTNPLVCPWIPESITEDYKKYLAKNSGSRKRKV